MEMHGNFLGRPVLEGGQAVSEYQSKSRVRCGERDTFHFETIGRELSG